MVAKAIPAVPFNGHLEGFAMSTISDAHVAALQSAVNEASDLVEASLILINTEARDPTRWREAIAALQSSTLARLRAARGSLDVLEEVAA